MHVLRSLSRYIAGTSENRSQQNCKQENNTRSRRHNLPADAFAAGTNSTLPPHILRLRCCYTGSGASYVLPDNPIRMCSVPRPFVVLLRVGRIGTTITPRKRPLAAFGCTATSLLRLSIRCSLVHALPPSLPWHSEWNGSEERSASTTKWQQVRYVQLHALWLRGGFPSSCIVEPCRLPRGQGNGAWLNVKNCKI